MRNDPLESDPVNRVGPLGLDDRWPGQVSAAIAYVGTEGDSHLPLRFGSSVIVDASESTVKARATNPHTLARWHQAGVAVYSLPRLHAKIVLADTTDEAPFVLVGSANASTRSASTLFEAAVVTDSTEVVDTVRHTLARWKTEAQQLDKTALSHLIELYDKSPVPDMDDDAANRQQDTSQARDDRSGPTLVDQRPKRIYITPVLTDAYISEEAEHHAEELATQFGASATYSPGSLSLDVYRVVHDESINYSEGTHLVPVYVTTKSQKSTGTSIVGEPCRVLDRWVGSVHDPDTQYFFLLRRQSAVTVKYSSLKDALNDVGVALEFEVGYLREKVLNAITGLWPDLGFDEGFTSG